MDRVSIAKLNRLSERIDWTLVLLLMLFFIISCFSIYSAQTSAQYNENFLIRQVYWYGVGTCMIGIVMFLNSDQYIKLSWYAYGFGLFLLIFLHFSPESIAPVINGAKSWFVIDKVGSIQPSELVKVFLIMALSKVIVSHKEKYSEKTLKTDFFILIKMGATTGAPLILIMLQSDFGTSLVILAILLGMILISGITWKIIFPLFTLTSAVIAAIIYFVIWNPEMLEKYLKIQPYQFLRIYAWLDPEAYRIDAGLHLLKSLDAIGSGMLSGKGFLEREVYIPEIHTDFIFSVIGEEYGFVGGSIVIGLFFLLIYHLTKTALDTTIPYNIYITTGIISMITFHVFQNIGMTIQVLPITGIPLPFISYGGSSIMGNMLAMGLIFSIHYHHKRYPVEEEKEE
ncbi:rod shape-determining protein RodA [Bacillus aquiflavi]|uniref:FtsW/RodA/SpoVE family cell cycle protein n=1 Tax=Bacillus aquiflavi TaxID=2672567 RepID=UPI001CA9B783|nr:FtsW/RodA/SpoVE family cell cycle protein [Bacillus aquiflavi]UAC48461.1 rod shape-determining protein RodA [Bacillus aquiflavi]